MNLLKKVLGKEIYEEQKRIGRLVVDNMKSRIVKEIGDKKEDLYVLQKEVFAELQEELEKRAAKAANKAISEAYIKMVNKIGEIVVIGPILASILKKYEKEILESVAL